MAGFIYIMSNPSFRVGQVKIGKSDRDPEEFRKYELETTGVPEPFRVEYYAFVEDHHGGERRVHQKLNHLRPNKQREFFDVSIPEAILLIGTCAIVIFEKSKYRTPEEIARIKRQGEQEESKRQERQRQEKQRILDETLRREVKAEKERQNGLKWDASKKMAASIFEVERKIFASKYAKTKAWPWFWLVMILMYGPIVVMAGADGVFAAVGGVVILGFFVYFFDLQHKKNLAGQVYSDTKFEELANLIYRGNDYMHFLRGLGVIRKDSFDRNQSIIQPCPKCGGGNAVGTAGILTCSRCKHIWSKSKPLEGKIGEPERAAEELQDELKRLDEAWSGATPEEAPAEAEKSKSDITNVISLAQRIRALHKDAAS